MILLTEARVDCYMTSASSEAATGCPVVRHVGCERHFEPIVAATPHPVRGARWIARGTKETRAPSGVQAVRDDHVHQQPRTPCTPDGVRLRRHSLLYTC